MPNYSFEQLSKPCSNGMGASAHFVSDWYTANNSPCMYFNICANTINTYPDVSTVPLGICGYQYPHTGYGYIGVCAYCPDPGNGVDSINFWAEYLSIKLKAQLKSNTCYYGEFYTSLANASELGTNRIALYLTQNTFTATIGSFTNTIKPQIEWDTTLIFTDTVNWVKISGKFIAQGGEQYLTIGNFKDGNHTKLQVLTSLFIPYFSFNSRNFAYNYIDDVSLYELPPPQLQSNYIICSNSDSLLLGDTSKIQTHYQWYADGILLTDTTSQIKIKPIQTTTYVLHTTQCTINTQTVVVTYSTSCESVGLSEPIIPNVFTPNNDGVNDVFKIELKNTSLINFSVYDRWGLLIKSDDIKTHTTILWDGRTTSGEPCTAGVYFYILQYTDVNGDTQKKNGFITLIK